MIRRYNPRFGWVTTGLSGFGDLGADGCASIMAEVQRLRGLAKTRSKKEHRAAAAAAAAAAMQRYQQCVAAAVPAPAPVLPTPITPPVTVTPAPVTPTPVTPEPIPYVPYSGGGGGGGGGVPEMVPMPEDGSIPATGGSYCYNAQGQIVPCESLQTPLPVTQPGYPDTAAAQVPLTPVNYVQMPSGGSERGGDQELVPYGEGIQMMPTAAEQTGMVPTAYADPYGQQGAGQTINEKDMIAQNGPTEYSDQWGVIQVLELVFPAAQAKAAAQAAATISPAGTGVQPGGEMKVEDFTAQYVLEGGQW